jgi:uncharacterized RDD family membrane protein YckC
VKCPKCGYLGFESVDRCRNCGYEFSLTTPPVELPELPIRSESEAGNPLDDLALIDAASPPPVSLPPFATVPPSSSLPLFSRNDDAPLITKASPPRPPLAVRRTPEVPKLRSAPLRTPMLDLSPSGRYEQSRPLAADEPSEPAGLAARLSACLLDALVLLAIDAVVVYFTIQICGLTLQDARVLPRGPLGAFLLFQNIGYLVAFTVGGQTLGKMAAGIRVVPTDGDTSIDLGHSIVRTLVWVLLAVPAGLGFLSALFAADHRGLHDRLAGTRVVRASV